jgi:DNA-binding LytR/AlgR family response regulator
MICDDEKAALDNVKKNIQAVCNDLNQPIEIFTYNNSKKAIDSICKNSEQFDILFLDIDMPEISGLEVAKIIRNAGLDIILIFISAHEQYVFDSIEYSPFRYIRKNLIKKEMPSAIKAAIRLLESTREHSSVIKTECGNIVLKHSRIMYYDVKGHNVVIHMIDGKEFSTRNTIKGFYKDMNDDNFVKINSGCVVNLKHIENISKDFVTLDNKKALVLSKSRLKEIRLSLMKYWGDKI